MKETDRIRDQLRRARSGETWHGPSLEELLAGVDAEAAAARPVAGAHTIWEITLHIAAWARIVAARVRGEPPEVTPEVDWPPAPAPTARAWDAARADIAAAHAELDRAAAAVDDAGLDRPLAPGSSSPYVQLHGVVQHDLYHGGQIGLLRKALGIE